MIGLSKLLVISIVCLFVAGCGVLIYQECVGEEDKGLNNEEEKVMIKNPATGEVWNSIEEYEFRELNLDENK